MKQLKKVLIEAFSDKQLQQALIPFRRRIQSKLTGDLANYVSALETVLQQAGRSTNMNDRDMRRGILLGATGQSPETTLFEPGTSTKPTTEPGKEKPGKEKPGKEEPFLGKDPESDWPHSLFPGKEKPGKEEPFLGKDPESDWPHGFFPGKDKPGEKPGKEEPKPEDEKDPPFKVKDKRRFTSTGEPRDPEGGEDMPSLSKVAHDPGKVPVTSRDIPKWKQNIYTQKDQPKFPDEEPKDEPYSVSRAKSYLAGEDEPLELDPGMMSRVKKGLERGKKPGAMPSSEPPPESKPKSGGLKFDPSSSYLDPAVTRKMNKKGELPSLKKIFKRGK